MYVDMNISRALPATPLPGQRCFARPHQRGEGHGVGRFGGVGAGGGGCQRPRGRGIPRENIEKNVERLWFSMVFVDFFGHIWKMIY